MPDETCRQLLDYVPFLGLISGKQQMATPLFTRLTETAIMSIVAGGLAMYVSVEVIQAELNSVKYSINRLDEKVETKFDKLDTKIEKVRGDVYIPLGKK